eukprot:Skav223499  [mRNA]  locus=scaffold1160:74475:77940:- [translate_table: standard]
MTHFATPAFPLIFESYGGCDRLLVMFAARIVPGPLLISSASGTWVTLGGRPETDQYFNFKKSNGTFFLQKGCDQAQEEDAKTICAKYLEAARHPDVFADCVFDVCRGGDETFAQNAAAFIAA